MPTDPERRKRIAYVTKGVDAIDGFRAVPCSRANFFLTETLDPELDSTRVFNEQTAIALGMPETLSR